MSEWEKINNPPRWAAEALDIKLGGHGSVVGRHIAHVKGRHYVYKVLVNEGIFDGILGGMPKMTYFKKKYAD